MRTQKRPFAWLCTAFLTGCIGSQFLMTAGGLSGRSCLFILIFSASVCCGFFLIGRKFYGKILKTNLRSKGDEKGAASRRTLQRDRQILLFGMLLCFGLGALRGDLYQSRCERELAWIQDTVAESSEEKPQVIGVVTEAKKQEKGTKLLLRQVRVRDHGTVSALTGGIYATVWEEESGREPPAVGSRIRFRAALERPEAATNPGVFDQRSYEESMGVLFDCTLSSWEVLSISPVRSGIATLQKRLSDRFSYLLPQEEASLAAAMVLGDDDALPKDTKTMYQENGIAHVLAISGLHINLLGMGLYHLLYKKTSSRLLSGGVTGGFLLFYGCLTGFSVSASRAVFMGFFFLAGELLGRGSDLLTTLSFGGALTLAKSPYLFQNLSFLLSYGALLGLGIFGKGWRPARNNPILQSLSTSLSVQAVLLPIQLMTFYTFAPYSLLLNLVVIPLMSPLLLFLLAGLLLSYLFFPLGLLFARGGGYLLRLLDLFCHLAERLPGHLLIVGKPATGLLFLYAGLAITAALCLSRGKKRDSMVLAAIGALILLLPWPKESAVTMVDVSQGECILLEGRDHTAFLVDGGSTDKKQVGTYVIAPVLKSKGISHVRGIVMTHWDADHVNGLQELLQMPWFRADEVWLPDVIPPPGDTGYDELKAWLSQREIPWRCIHAGMKLKAGGFALTCLYPEQGRSIASANEASLVMSLTYGNFHMLLTGDVEERGERTLVMLPSVDVDVYKAAHHGSGTSNSEAVLDWCTPQICLISCGAHNSYGHPHPEFLERLREREIPWYQTPRHGAVRISLQKNGWRIRSFLDVSAEEK